MTLGYITLTLAMLAMLAAGFPTYQFEPRNPDNQKDQS